MSVRAFFLALSLGGLALLPDVVRAQGEPTEPSTETDATTDADVEDAPPADVESGASDAAETAATTEDETGAALAEAEETTPSTRRVVRNALLVYPFAFLRRGFALAYERAFPHRRLSVLGRWSYDRQAAGDFRSNAVGLGLESRWYFLGRGPFTKYDGPAPVGPYFGLRAQWMVTRLRTDNREFLGSAHRFTGEGAFGLRMVFAGIVELTPYLSLAFNTDVIDGLASVTRMTAGVGAALGVLFERR